MSNDERMDEAIQRAKKKFWDASREGFYRLMDEAPQIWTSSDAKLYRTEKRIIFKHIDPFYTGAFTTVFLFATFRVSGSRWFTRLRENLFASPGSGKNLVPPQQVKNKTSREWKGYLEKEGEVKTAMEKDLSQLPIDLLLSALCGCSSVVWFSQPKELQKDFAELPLVSGGSLVHSYCCDEFEKAFQQLDKETFENNPDDEILRTFHMFVQNCRIRSEFIRSRELEGYETPAIIPHPGIFLKPK
jgi:hypothetical protein